jgi:hypothetical protein
MGHTAEEGKDIGGDNQTQRMGRVFRMGKEIFGGGLADGDVSFMVIRYDTVQIHIGEQAENEVVHLIWRGLPEGQISSPFEIIHEIGHSQLLSLLV